MRIYFGVQLMKIFKWLGLAIVCAAALSVMVAAPSKAATIYTYTGNPFTTEVQGVYSTTDRVTGWFELASPLGINSGYTDISANLEAFSFSDGIQTFTGLDPIIGFNIGTGVAGVPLLWTINLGDEGFNEIYSCSLGFLGCSPFADFGVYFAPDNAESFGEVIANPGSWTVSTTPLPAALPLFAAGLGALGLLGWRRKRKDRTAIAA